MNYTFTRAAVLACLLAAHVPAFAETATGRVVGVYVETSPGVRVERNGNSAHEGLPQYAEVRLADAEGAPRTKMVRIDEFEVEPGDTVTIELAGRGMRAGPRAAPARIVRIEARANGTLVQRAVP